MGSWMFTLRGIRYRPGRSLVVALIAMVATASAVVIPAYGRAAAQSVLTDTILDTPPVLAGLTATPRARTGGGAPATLEEAIDGLRAALAVRTTLAGHLEPPVATASVDARIAGPQRLRTQFVHRQRACEHVRVASGQCPTAAGQVMVSVQAASVLHLAVGDEMRLFPSTPVGEARESVQARVVGLFEPVDPAGPYWGFAVSFPGLAANGQQSVVDAVLAGAATDVMGKEIPANAWVEMPLTERGVDLDEQAALLDDVRGMQQAMSREAIVVESALPALLQTTVDRQQQTVSSSFPLIALPLVLLCWLVLFMVVASLTEERGPEIAVGKLHGLRFAQVGGFGVREPLLLVAVGAIGGSALGLLVTELGARAFLAEGAHVELRAPVFIWLGVALVGAAVAAGLATRRTVVANVMTLMRRVPARAGWRLAAVEGALAVLCVVAVSDVVINRGRPTTWTYLAPSLLALLAGLVVARLIAAFARVRLGSARARGRLVGLLTAAQLARRPAALRVVAVLTTAVGLLTFGVTFWDVAAVNREVAAQASVGADRVYTVEAGRPATLLDAVRRADPSGQHAMAVVHDSEYFDGAVGVIGVDSTRLAAVARWPDVATARVADLAARLHTDPVPAAVVRGPHVEIDATVATFEASQPMELGLVLGSAGGGPQSVPLGDLRAGRHTYTGSIIGCDEGCALLGIAVRRGPGDFEPGAVDLTVRAVRDARGAVDAQLTAADRWRTPLFRPTGQTLTVRPSGDGLSLVATSRTPNDVVAEFADTPDATPAVVAGGTPADDPTAATFTFGTIGATPEALRVVDRLPVLPRVGQRGVVFDLETAIRQASHHGPPDFDGEFEVWTNGDAGADFAATLESVGLRVTDVETLDGRRDRLARQAPALALRLYLLAGGVAVLLGLGVVLLSAFVGASGRLYDLAALWVTGVSRRTLRRATRREYGLLVGLPLVIGVLAGLAGAALLLPTIPLVSVDDERLAPVYHADLGWLGGSLAVVAALFAVVVLAVLRGVHRATPERLREGER